MEHTSTLGKRETIDLVRPYIKKGDVSSIKSILQKGGITCSKLFSEMVAPLNQELADEIYENIRIDEPVENETSLYFIVCDYDYNNEVILGVASSEEEARKKQSEIRTIQKLHRSSTQSTGYYLCDDHDTLSPYIVKQIFRDGIAVERMHMKD